MSRCRQAAPAATCPTPADGLMSRPSRRSSHSDPRPVGKVRKGLMGPSSLGKRRRVNRALAQAWDEAAGPEVASQTRVRGLRRGVVTIEVDSGPLCHRLASFQREELLLALKERVRETEILDLRFRAGA